MPEAMPGTDDTAPRAQTLLDEIERLGVTHTVGIPDNSSAALFRLLAASQRIRHLTVTREGEAFAVASGIWLGGGTPLVVVQNTGLLESGDALRGTAVRMGVPLLCVVTYRGYQKMEQLGAGASDVMTRADADSVAYVTEPTLHAWRIPFEYYHSDDDAAVLRSAAQRASEQSQPFALLLTRALV